MSRRVRDLGLKMEPLGPKKRHRVQKKLIGPKKRPIGPNAPLLELRFLEKIVLISTETLYIILVYIHTYILTFERRTIYMFHSTRALPIRLHLESNDTLNRNKCVYSATGEF